MTLADAPLSQASPDSLSDRDEQVLERRADGSRINVGDVERTVSVAAGGLIALLGLSRRSVPGLLLAGVGGGLIYRGLSGRCPMYRAMDFDTSNAGRGATAEDFYKRGIHVEVSMTINKSPWELYQLWRNFENLPKIMSHLESVTVTDGKRSHWIAKAPSIAGGKVEWDAEIINDEPTALIAWRSLPNADVDNAGSVRFVPAPGDRGTEVKVVIDYIPPAGVVGKWAARLFGEDPETQITEDLRRFKRIMETGEAATTKGQPRGDCGGCGSSEE
jgi:uncharacterized membrane protein